MQTYCLECHDSDSSKGGLDFEVLSEDFNEGDVRMRWIQVLDRVRLNEMPPRDKNQPEGTVRRQFLTYLEAGLHDASFKKQRDGRVILRRLNRTEYENTLHDLLDVSVELQSLLPEDNQVAGFDKVSLGLGTSAVHLVRYQEAAALALSHA
ncbi:MAG: DUF1587 domain-containing protein, partial [Opitutae bacterium]